MIHVYTVRSGRWSGYEEYKLLCTGTWVDASLGEKFVTAPWNASCPKCLDISIAKLEVNLKKMKDLRGSIGN